MVEGPDSVDIANGQHDKGTGSVDIANDEHDKVTDTVDIANGEHDIGTDKVDIANDEHGEGTDSVDVANDEHDKGPGTVDIPNDEHDKGTGVHADTEIEYINCDQCLLKPEKTKGTRYCGSCLKYLCDKCANIHKTTKETHSHNVLVFEDIPRAQQALLILANATSCPVHPDEEFDYVCVQHGQCIYSKCDKDAHANCDILKEIVNMVDPLKDRKDLEESLRMLNRVRQFLVDEINLKADDLYYMRMEQYYVTAGRNCIARMFYELHTTLVRPEAKEKKQVSATKVANKANEQLFHMMAKKIVELEGDKMMIEKIVRGQMNIEELIQTTLNHGTEKQIYIIRSDTKGLVKRNLIAARSYGFVEHDPIKHNALEKFEDVLMVRGAAGEERILKRHLKDKDSARVTKLKEERILSKGDMPEGVMNYAIDHAFAGIRGEQIREIRKALERANTSNKEEDDGKISTVTDNTSGDDTKEDISVGNATMNGSEKDTLTTGLSNATVLSDQLPSISITKHTIPKQVSPKKRKICGQGADIKSTLPSSRCSVSARPTPISPLKSEAQHSKQQSSFTTSGTNEEAYRQSSSPQPLPRMALDPVSDLMTRRLIFVGNVNMYMNYKPCSILGMTTLADGRFVFMHEKNVISVFDVNLQYLFYHQLPIKPRAICHLGGTIIALAWESEKGITFFQIESNHLKALHSMELQKQCRAIAKYPEGIAVLFVEDDNFEIEIRKPGETQTRKITRFEHNNLPVKMNPVSFLFSENHGFLIGDTSKGLICFDETGRQQWCYDGDVYKLNTPRIIDVTGIAEDKMGNIYACGRGTANVHQISSIGYAMHMRILIDLHKLARVHSVVIDRFNRLLVGCYNEDSVKVYGFV